MAILENDEIMLHEILNQPRAWAATIEAVTAQAPRLRALAGDVDEIVFTGCGSGLNAATAIAPVCQSITGVRARAVPAAEMVFFPETVFVKNARYLVVPISRSGTTTETVQARDVASGRGMPTLGITCYPDSPLARSSSAALVLAAANEASVTTTQSLTAMVLAGQVLSALIAGDGAYLHQLQRLPALGERLLGHCHDLGRTIGSDRTLTKFAFVGSGMGIGLAREGQLKIKEMTLLPSDAYPILDFRHGPKSNVDEHMLITVLSTDRTRRIEREFLAEMRGLGGRQLLLCERAEEALRAHVTWMVAVESGLSDFARGILFMLPIHFLAYYKSLSLGLSPSTPTNLSYWVATQSL
jgi:glucosamine--fructose-6-phosphate aminotransferase (isomerizing)